jgi:predicted outer membrane protein
MKSLGIALAASLFLAATPAAAQAPNDAQIASIVVTANQVDIDASSSSRRTIPPARASNRAARKT